MHTLTGVFPSLGEGYQPACPTSGTLENMLPKNSIFMRIQRCAKIKFEDLTMV